LLQEGAELNEKKDYSNLGTTEERLEAGNREQGTGNREQGTGIRFLDKKGKTNCGEMVEGREWRSDASLHG
jgi:hypothetical protein